MNILALENSTQNLSIAVKRGDEVFEQNKPVPRGSEHIIPTIDRILRKAKLDIAQIGLFALGLGPGSFTGLRVCVSIIKGFSLPLKKPVVGIPSFTAIAEELMPCGRNTAIIFDARKDLVYAAVYKRAGLRVKPLKQARLTRLDYFLRKSCNKDCLFAGESVKFKGRIYEVFPEAVVREDVTYPKAAYLLPQAEEDYRNKRLVKVRDLEPLYLHPETCQIRGRKR